jgi:GH15 family glucan-1,4-alpha-glucosidase
VQAAGSQVLDAAALLAARRGFGDSAGERRRSTIDAVRRGLGRGPLLFRYEGMEQAEGAFVPCSFWLVEALALAGRIDEAEELLDDLGGAANDLGLYAEEIDPESRELLGNFPQGLSHLGLVTAAATLEEARRASRSEAHPRPTKRPGR